jgi:hypothetical protein
MPIIIPRSWPLYKASSCENGCTMSIKIWECLRGYDRWIETEAAIRSSGLAEVEAVLSGDTGRTPSYEWRGYEELVRLDREGNEYRKGLAVSENSPLFSRTMETLLPA